MKFVLPCLIDNLNHKRSFIYFNFFLNNSFSSWEKLQFLKSKELNDSWTFFPISIYFSICSIDFSPGLFIKVFPDKHSLLFPLQHLIISYRSSYVKMHPVSLNSRIKGNIRSLDISKGTCFLGQSTNSTSVS